MHVSMVFRSSSEKHALTKLSPKGSYQKACHLVSHSSFTMDQIHKS